MKRNTIYKLALVPVLLFGLQSCFVAREYQRPEVVYESHYRPHQLPVDSTRLADVSWGALFTDTNLVSSSVADRETTLQTRIPLKRCIALAYYFTIEKATV